VVARGFRFPPTADSDVIAPLTLPLQAPAQRKSSWVFAVGRVAANRPVAAATAELAAIARQMEAEHPEQNRGSTYYAVPLREALVGSTGEALVLLLAAVGFVLLIACVNVANLQVARALGRRRETAVRLALGARRGQLAGLFLSENLALVAIACVAGIVLAHWGVRALVALVPESVSVPGLADVRVNGAVLAFTLGIAAVAAVGFGAVAAATVRLQHAGDVLVSAGRATMTRLMRRATSALVVAEVALATVLLIGAGLVLRSFAGLLAVDPGFRYDDVLAMQIQLPAGRYADPAARASFYAAAFDAVRAQRGVTEVGAAVVVPLTGNNWTLPFQRADQPAAPGQRPPDVGWQLASGGYFRALGIPLKSGRVFDAGDGPGGRPVVVVSEAIERHFFAGESAVGRHVRLGDGTAEIVGVVGDIRRAGLDDTPRQDLYLPFEAAAPGQITLFVQAKDPAGAAAGVRAALREAEPQMAFLWTRTLRDIASESVRARELVVWLLGVFALLALALAAVGVYGVMSYVVRHRAREIGTRMAVGATRRDIAWLVLRQGGMVAALGVGAGLGIGLAATRALRSVLYGVSPSDPATLAAAAAVLAATTLAACWLPARRAAALDPARTLSAQ
jgi:predicted permease